MNLREFVSTSITEIMDGVAKAQEEAKKHKAMVNPRHISKTATGVTLLGDSGPWSIQVIEFDVAVTATESGGAKGGIGIFVGAVGVGTQGHSEAQNTNLSRIKFSIPVALPYQDRYPS